jgi:1,4-dihydroxy-6-naphthoate synthase
VSRIRVACSPDADDLFMMRALIEGRLETHGLDLEVITVETDALNRLAGGDGPEVSAMSIAWYPKIAQHYRLLPHGGSVGEGYGPVVVAREPMDVAALAGRRVAVPGITTTAFAVLRMMVPSIDPVVTPITPYSRIFDALRAGEVDAGLVIHEGRLTYEDEGFVRVAELGEWWLGETGLPLPLGGNAIRRDLGDDVIRRVSAVLRGSIADGLRHREEAIEWLLKRGGALKTRERVDRYLGMYANQRTLDYGDDGRQAIRLLLRRLGFYAEIDFAT